MSLTDVKNDVTATAQMIEYNQMSDVALLQMEIELKQKDNVCKGAYAVYRKKDQMLELSGNAQIKQGDDSFRAQEITLNLDSQEITLDGRVKGSVVDERKTEKQDDETEQIEGSAENGAEEEAEANADGAGQHETADEKSADTEKNSAANDSAENTDSGIKAAVDKGSERGGQKTQSDLPEKADASVKAAMKNQKSSAKSKKGKK